MEMEPDLFGGLSSRIRKPSAHRWYYAILPPPKLAQAIEDQAERRARTYGVRRVTKADRLHLTLNRLPNGEPTAPELLDDAIEVGGNVRRPSFDLCFDRLETWGGGRDESGRRQFATVLRCSAPPRAAQDLYRDLGRELSAYGLPARPRAFSPHITVWYQDSRIEPVRLQQPIRFRAEHFWLVHSITGARRLEHIASWPLKF